MKYFDYVDSLEQILSSKSKPLHRSDIQKIKMSSLYPGLKTGDLFMTSRGSFGNRIIRFVTRGVVAHVGIFVELCGVWYIAESIQGKGVRMIPFHNRVKNGDSFYWGRMLHRLPEDEVRERIISDEYRNDVPQIGDNYDWVGVLLANWFDVKNNLAYCSEYVIKILKQPIPLSGHGPLPDAVAQESEWLADVKVDTMQ